MNVLVTGANGQLGTEMRNVSSESSDRYIFTDIAELDITDSEAVDKLVTSENIDIIVNCAAYTNVDKAEEDEQAADIINHKAVAILASAAADKGATLIHISTDYVFDGNSCVPYREEDMTFPTGAYGRTKLAGEQAVIESGCRYIILRTSWLYSPYGKNFVKTMMRLTAEKENINVVFDQVGTPTYTGDLAALIYKIITDRHLDRQGIYHYSNEGVCSWYDFAVEICRICGNACDIRPCHSEEFPSKVKRPNYSVLDKTKVKESFGLTVPYWRSSLEKCVKILQYLQK